MCEVYWKLSYIRFEEFPKKAVPGRMGCRRSLRGAYGRRWTVETLEAAIGAEPSFAIAQGAVLVLFIIAGLLLVRRFHPVAAWSFLGQLLDGNGGGLLVQAFCRAISTVGT